MTGRGVNESDCPFCAIVRGEDSSAEVICSDDCWLAFFPLDPATPGHTLIVPRTHVTNLWEVEASLVSELMLGVLRVGRAIRIALQPEGLNLITSAGSAAEQTVFHLHLHVVPRWRRDEFGQIWPIEGKRYADSALNNAAERVRKACRQDG